MSDTVRFVVRGEVIGEAERLLRSLGYEVWSPAEVLALRELVLAMEAVWELISGIDRGERSAVEVEDFLARLRAARAGLGSVLGG